MGKIHRFEDIEAWQMARALAQDIYRQARKESFSRDWGLKDQICRAAVSIMSNIAEGFERGSNKDFVKFMFIARGSAGEVRSLLHIASDLAYISPEELVSAQSQCCRISAAIWGLIAYLRKSDCMEP